MTLPKSIIFCRVYSGWSLLWAQLFIFSQFIIYNKILMIKSILTINKKTFTYNFKISLNQKTSIKIWLWAHQSMLPKTIFVALSLATGAKLRLCPRGIATVLVTHVCSYAASCHLDWNKDSNHPSRLDKEVVICKL